MAKKETMANELKEKKTKAPKAKVLTVTGKRKTAIARATIREGNGMIRINHKPLETLSHLRRLMILEPLRIAEDVIKDDLKKISIDVRIVAEVAKFKHGTTARRIDLADMRVPLEEVACVGIGRADQHL